METYVATLQSYSIRATETAQLALSESVEAVATSATKLGLDTDIRQELKAAAENALLQHQIIIDISDIDPKAGTSSIICDRGTTVSQLLDILYFHLERRVRPYSYGDEWVLLDKSKNLPLFHIGPKYAEQHLGRKRDDRSLADVGIYLDTRLAALRYSSARRVAQLQPSENEEQRKVVVTLRKMDNNERVEISTDGRLTVREAVENSGLTPPGKPFSVRNKEGNEVGHEDVDKYQHSVLSVVITGDRLTGDLT